MPDFFLDEFLTSSNNKMPSPTKQAPEQSGKDIGVEQVFKTITAMANEDIVKKTNAIYAFEIKGSGEGQWYLDLKNGSGSAGKGTILFMKHQ